MLKDILEIINNTDMELELNLSAMGDGKVCLLVTPLVGKVSDTASEAEKQLKAALSVPLKIKGTPDEVEEALTSRIKEYQAPRENWIDKAKELDKTVRKAEEKSNRTRPAAKKTTTPAAKKPAQKRPRKTNAKKAQSEAEE